MMLPYEKIFELGYKDFCLLSAESFLSRKANSFDFNIPLIVYGVSDGNAEGIRKKIAAYFGTEAESHGDFLIAKQKPLTERSVYSYGDLVEIIWRLRDEDGCPWDRAQTNMTIREDAIEEAYELVEAIELDDAAKMREESGDVLLQGLFNAVIAEGDGRFSVNDVVSELCHKLVSRHTHIFGENVAKNSEEALFYWEQAKAKEKSQKTVVDKIDAVPKTFGALQRANKVQKIVRKAGFDFATPEEAVYKIAEETDELLHAEGAEKEKEAGDLLFAAINVIRLFGIDPELALTRSTNTFIKRFSYVEQKAAEHGKKVAECSIEEMTEWYDEYKRLNNR